MRSKLFAIFAAVLFAGPVLAQPQTLPRPEDHLEPSHSVLGGGFKTSYEFMLRDVLHAAYEPDVQLRMVGQPSFIPEFAVGLRGGKTIGKGDFKSVVGGAPYRIFGLTPAASVWIYESIASMKRGAASATDEKSRALTLKSVEKLQASVPADIRDVKVARCEMDISDVLGDRITQVWRKMLMRTRYSQQNLNGTDGAFYDFSMFSRGLGDLSGHVWLPDRNSSTGTLVALANAMYRVCTKQKDASMEKLEALTAELERRLN